MTELTAEKIRLVLLTVQAMRLTGRIPADADVSPRRLEAISHELGCPVSEKTFRVAEHRARKRFKLAALALQAAHASKS
jgi:hypothetical protein